MKIMMQVWNGIVKILTNIGMTMEIGTITTNLRGKKPSL